MITVFFLVEDYQIDLGVGNVDVRYGVVILYGESKVSLLYMPLIKQPSVEQLYIGSTQLLPTPLQIFFKFTYIKDPNVATCTQVC